MTKELTDGQIDEATLEILGFAALDSAQNITARMIARKVIAADRELQDARWREELNAYELRCSNLRAELAGKNEWNRNIRDSVDSLLSAGGYNEDSSVRNQLGCMNFGPEPISAAPQPPAQPELDPTGSKTAESCGEAQDLPLQEQVSKRPERKPMTGPEMDQTIFDCGICRTGKDIVRAVEAFHGIKETS